MLGQTISMVLPEVVGYKLTGVIGSLVTSTDVVLTITKVTGVIAIAMTCPEVTASYPTSYIIHEIVSVMAPHPRAPVIIIDYIKQAMYSRRGVVVT